MTDNKQKLDICRGCWYGINTHRLLEDDKISTIEHCRFLESHISMMFRGSFEDSGLSLLIERRRMRSGTTKIHCGEEGKFYIDVEKPERIAPPMK